MIPILYVEDEADYQMLVQRILRKAGFDVTVAASAAEGLSALERIKPSLLILDVNLPDADGYSLCRTLRQGPQGLDVPILMLTVRRRPEEWLKAFSCGANEYVPKPLNPPELVERVRHCLESRRKTAGRQDAEYLLIQTAVSGNRAAFEVLIQKYKGRLVEALHAPGKSVMEAEELASDAFARAFERLGQFRGRASFYTWLYRIAVNELHHQQRNKKNVSLEEMTGGDESLLPAVLVEPDRVEEALSKRVLHAQIQRAVTYIPKPYRQILRWYFMRGLSYQRVGRQLKIPPGTVMSRLFKAKELLRQAWKQTHR